MKVQRTENITFKSRNKTIRFADDVARRVNICYPRISTSLIDDFKNVELFDDFRADIGEKLENTVRDEICEKYFETDNLIGKLLAFIKPIKKHHIGNCGESAQIAAIVAKVNGIKNCFLASLKKANGKNLDHTVVYIDGEKPYIIDAWLGFADYEDNAFTRYKCEYSHHFDMEEGDKLQFTELITDYTDSLNHEFSRPQINKLKKIYPNHVIRRGYV